jgi:hypothetical protein
MSELSVSFKKCKGIIFAVLIAILSGFLPLTATGAF